MSDVHQRHLRGCTCGYGKRCRGIHGDGRQSGCLALQNYTTDSIEVYYTPATCSTGRLILSGSMTVSDKDRFWSLVLSAKLTGRDVGVVYDMVSSDCVVQSFFLP